MSVARMASLRAAVKALQQASQQLEKAVAEAVQLTEPNGQTAESMGQLNHAMVGSLDRVSATVEENTAATEALLAGSGNGAQAIENIATVSRKNSAAPEEA